MNGAERPRSRVRMSAIMAFAAVALTACGSAATPPSGSAPAGRPTGTVAGITIGEKPALRGLLPASIRRSGVVRVASNAPYPPYVAFKSPGSRQWVGFDVDLADAIGAVLGVRFQFQQLPFDGIIPAVAAGRADVVMGGLSDTRQREQVLDFVDYNIGGLLLIVAAGNRPSIHGLADLCGKPVSAQSATDQAALLEKLNTSTCSSNKIRLILVPQEPDAQLAVQSGRADAEMTGSLTAAQLVRANPQQFAIVHDPSAPHGYAPGPNAIGLSKKATGLRMAIVKALQHLIDDGVYRKLLNRHGMAFTALRTATVNGAPR